VLFTAENRDRLPLKPGQRVEIETPRLPLLKQTLGAILPLFPGFAGGWALGGFFLPGEAGRALAGVLGLFAAGAGVYLLRRRFPVKTLPRIRRALIS
jgi:hypothetical protein